MLVEKDLKNYNFLKDQNANEILVRHGDGEIEWTYCTCFRTAF